MNSMKENTLRAAHRSTRALSLCLCLVATSTSVWSEDRPTNGSSAEPGTALREGIRLYRRGDFEQASESFALAQAQAAKLSAQDQNVLAEYADRSTRAMVERNQARMELSEAESALLAKDVEKARALLVRASSNRFLAADDIEKVKQLEQKLHGGPGNKDSWASRFRLFPKKQASTGTPTEPIAVPTSPITPVGATEEGSRTPAGKMEAGDARQLLAEGRRFFKRGLFAQAERFAQAAAEAQVSWDPAGDSPERLLAEIRSMQSGSDGVKKNPTVPTPTTVNTSGKGNRAEALALLAEGRRQLQAGNLEAAKASAVKVYSMNLGLTPADGDTPEQLFSDYKRALVKGVETGSAPSPAPLTPPASPAPTSGTSSSTAPTTGDVGQLPSVDDKYRATSDKRDEARKLVSQARAAMSRGDHATAIQLAKKAEATGVKFPEDEDSPAMIYEAHNAIRAREEQRRKASETAAKGQEARQLVAQAHRVMEAGDFDQAMTLAQKALNMDAVYKPSELTPGQLMVEIEQRAAQASLAEAQARQQAREMMAEQAKLPRPGKGKPSSPAIDPAVMPTGFNEGEPVPAAVGVIPSAPMPASERVPTVIQAAGPGKGPGLLDAGINAMGRGDYAQAKAYLQEAAKYPESLSDGQKQRLQDLSSEVMLRAKDAPTEQPGKRSISDMPTGGDAQQFAGLQETDPSNKEIPRTDVGKDEIAAAKARQQILLQKLKQDVIEAVEQSSMQLRDNPDRAIETLRTAMETVKASGLEPNQVSSLVSRLEQQIRQAQRARQEWLSTAFSRISKRLRATLVSDRCRRRFRSRIPSSNFPTVTTL